MLPSRSVDGFQRIGATERAASSHTGGAPNKLQTAAVSHTVSADMNAPMTVRKAASATRTFAASRLVAQQLRLRRRQRAAGRLAMPLWTKRWKRRPSLLSTASACGILSAPPKMPCRCGRRPRASRAAGSTRGGSRRRSRRGSAGPAVARIICVRLMKTLHAGPCCRARAGLVFGPSMYLCSPRPSQNAAVTGPLRIPILRREFR